MAITRQQLCQALDLVELATKELVEARVFHHAVLNRLRQTVRPADLKALAAKICRKASTTKTSSTKGMNGVALDQRGKASLESLVLHYASQAPDLFPPVSVQMIRCKLSGHNGPRFQGPWP